jgi:hypothetical protein
LSSRFSVGFPGSWCIAQSNWSRNSSSLGSCSSNPTRKMRSR